MVYWLTMSWGCTTLVVFVLSKTVSHYSLKMCICLSESLDSRRSWLSSSVTLLPSLIFISSPFTWPFDFISESLLLWQLCLAEEMKYSVCVAVWNLCECARMQTDSQTVVPAESSYRHQGRLNRDEQMNDRLCVLLIKYKKLLISNQVKACIETVA